MAVRQLQHLIVDLVDAQRVARAPVGGERAGAEADHAELQRPRLRQGENGAADAGLLAVVGVRHVARLAREVLLAVVDAPVHHHALPAGIAVVPFGDAQLAVEIARGDDVAVDEFLRHHAEPPAVAGQRQHEEQAPVQAQAAPQHDHRQQRAEEQPDRQFEVGRERRRRDEADKEAAQRSAQREHQVEQRQVARMRLPPHQLAVADHAEDEQRGGDQRDHPRHGQAVVEDAVDAEEGDGQGGEEQRAHVVARRIEAEDEAEQVEGQRQHPQEGHRRHVLRQVAGHRQQQGRRRHRQRSPQQAVAPGRTRHVGGQGHGRFLPGRHLPPRPPGRRAAGGDEEGVAGRPQPGLTLHRQEGFHQHRVAEQRQHRGEVRQRVEAVGHDTGEGARIPGLHQRAGGRQQQVGQADRHGQHAEHAEGRIRLCRLLPGRIGRHRQGEQAQEQQRGVHQRLPPRRQRLVQPVHIQVAQQQLGLEEHQAGAPHRGGAAEPGQDHLRHHRLDLEQQEGREEDGEGEERHGGGILMEMPGKVFMMAGNKKASGTRGRGR